MFEWITSPEAWVAFSTLVALEIVLGIDNQISGRDIILILGGIFLLAKSTHEIHNSLEIQTSSQVKVSQARFFSVLAQIAILDIVFSLDSVITAVGLVDDLPIMVLAILVSVAVMLLSAKAIGSFVDKNPAIKMLALSFLILIGFTLVAEGFEVHVPKGYIYFAMAFSIGVELLNMRARRIKETVSVQLMKMID